MKNGKQDLVVNLIGLNTKTNMERFESINQDTIFMLMKRVKSLNANIARINFTSMVKRIGMTLLILRLQS